MVLKGVQSCLGLEIAAIKGKSEIARPPAVTLPTPHTAPIRRIPSKIIPARRSSQNDPIYLLGMTVKFPTPSALGVSGWGAENAREIWGWWQRPTSSHTATPRLTHFPGNTAAESFPRLHGIRGSLFPCLEARRPANSGNRHHEDAPGFHPCFWHKRC